MTTSISPTKTTIVPAGQTVDVYSLEVDFFKSAKFIVAITGAGSVSAFESVLTHNPTTHAPVSSVYGTVGDVIDYTYAYAYVSADGKIYARLTNNTLASLTITIGEIEKIE